MRLLINLFVWLYFRFHANRWFDHVRFRHNLELKYVWYVLNSGSEARYKRNRNIYFKLLWLMDVRTIWKKREGEGYPRNEIYMPDCWFHDTRRKENTPFPFQKKGEILLHFTSCGHIKHHFYALYISQKLRARWLCRLPHSISKLSASARKSIQRERGREKENRDCMRLSVCLVSDSTSLPMSCFIAPEKS